MNDDELSDFLRERLPRRTAPASLRARIERGRGGRWRPTNLLVALAAVAFVSIVLVLARRAPLGRESNSPLVAEAVNDHLRLLYAEHPLEIQSGGIHQVKPWFAGRVDFAPAVSFEGDEEFPLQGGAIAYYIDRKAAAFVYKHKLHVITLLVFPAGGLPWEKGDVTASSRGFHVALWRSGDLGYALVSDAAAEDLAKLEQRLKAAR